MIKYSSFAYHKYHQQYKFPWQDPEFVEVGRGDPMEALDAVELSNVEHRRRDFDDRVLNYQKLTHTMYIVHGNRDELLISLYSGREAGPVKDLPP